MGKVKIIQIIGVPVICMPNDEYRNGQVLGLGDDGVVYIDRHADGISEWVVYMPLEFEDRGE